MYRLGHYGVALLVYAPIGFALATVGVPPALVASGGVIMLAFALVPDMDQRLGILTHRGFTHTVWFAGGCGLFTGVAWAGLSWWVATQLATVTVRPVLVIGSATLVGALVTLSVLSHLLADILTPSGLHPFYPVSDAWYSWEVTTANSWVANRLLFVGGLGGLAAAIYAGAVLFGQIN